jgi:hypothetical protein
VSTLPLSPDLIGETLKIETMSRGRESLPSQFIYGAAHLKPLSPVHLQLQKDGAELNISWIRRSRVDSDSWLGEVPLGEEDERYRGRLWSGEDVAEEGEVAEPFYQSQHPNITKIDVAQGSDLLSWGNIAELVVS